MPTTNPEYTNPEFTNAHFFQSSMLWQLSEARWWAQRLILKPQNKFLQQ